jgi:hypothetical protein
MKTHTAIKHTATLLSAALLLALPARAVQSFYKTHSSSTGDSRFGAVATFYAYDNHVAPVGSTLGSYSVTAGGSVVGKVLSKSFTGLSGSGTVKAMSNGTGTFSGTLSALGFNLFNVSNRALPYSSQPFIRDWSAEASVHFTIYVIPCEVKAKVTASINARFRVDTSSSSITVGGVPRLDIKMGPVADLAASAEAGVYAGFEGLASVGAGATGSLRVGKVSLTLNANVGPVQTVATTTTATFQSTSTTTPIFATVSTVPTMTLVSTTPAPKGNATISLTASMSGIWGALDVWAQAELWPFGAHREWKRIAEYTYPSASVNLLGPVTYTWY